MLHTEWGGETEDWWALDLCGADCSIAANAARCHQQNLKPWLNQSEDLGQSLDSCHLEPGLEPGLMAMEDSLLECPSLPFDFDDQGQVETDMLFQGSISYDGFEDTSQKPAFKESFINASRSQSPIAEILPRQSESTPSSASMIAIADQSPVMMMRDTPIYKQSSFNATFDGAFLGLAGCASSTNLRQLNLQNALNGTDSKDSSQGSDDRGISEAESDQLVPDAMRIDLLCKGETLGSDLDEPPMETAGWFSPYSSQMDFIRMSNTQPRIQRCASVATSVGSPKRDRSPVSEAGGVKLEEARLSEGPTLTKKLLVAFSSSSRGPVSAKDIEAAALKPTIPIPIKLEKAVVKKPAAVVKKSAAAAKKPTAIAKKSKAVAKRPTAVQRHESQAQEKQNSKVLHEEDLVPCPPLRRRPGRPKKLTEAGAQYKIEQSPKRKRKTSTKAKAPSTQACSQCATSVTPVWRLGPDGPKTLCNACGVRYMKITKRK